MPTRLRKCRNQITFMKSSTGVNMLLFRQRKGTVCRFVGENDPSSPTFIGLDGTHNMNIRKLCKKYQNTANVWTLIDHR